MVTQEELGKLRREFDAQATHIDALAKSNAAVRRIHEEWSLGVCLIHGMFRLQLADGSWFILNGTEPYDFEYTGSGFLVDAEGDIITNRHVVIPWESIDELAPLLEGGATPHFSRLTATFPGHRPQPIPVDSIRVHPNGMDVAIARLAATAVAGIPALPLARRSIAATTTMRS